MRTRTHPYPLSPTRHLHTRHGFCNQLALHSKQSMQSGSLAAGSCTAKQGVRHPSRAAVAARAPTPHQQSRVGQVSRRVQPAKAESGIFPKVQPDNKAPGENALQQAVKCSATGPTDVLVTTALHYQAPRLSPPCTGRLADIWQLRHTGTLTACRARAAPAQPNKGGSVFKGQDQAQPVPNTRRSNRQPSSSFVPTCICAVAGPCRLFDSANPSRLTTGSWAAAARGISPLWAATWGCAWLCHCGVACRGSSTFHPQSPYLSCLHVPAYLVYMSSQ